ncbi:hypothetical protein [Pseudaestuariivita rosea]|uniref:hypothetical protein n=1 Tax=Pseudaestuariivita rosea TaxID=2763263 RepID=UPI001F17BD7E|nr:hypothetical protein [Pseudaestuariivita rosea]
MRASVFAILSLSLVLAGCATVRESRINPMNWFGNTQDETMDQTAQAEVPQDPRPLVNQIVSLQVDRAPGGAVIRAVGLPPTQGYFAGELIPRQTIQDGVLTYDFRVVPPIERAAVGTQASREVVVGRFVTDQRLAGVRVIRVVGQQNAQTARR